MKLPSLYYIQYRIQLTLGLYGYIYNVHHNNGESPWPWYQYLYGDLRRVPMGVRGFMHYDDALEYVNTNRCLYISRDRYIP